MLKSFVTVAAGLIGGAHAFWRMECPGRVGLARLDPIMSPGEVSEHAHSIHGSSGFSETSDTPELLAGNCTSCRVTQDKSGYWHPSLYFQDASTGEFELVEQVGGMLAYYLLYGDNITAFPTGFRMISGNTTRRTYTAGDPSEPDPPKSDWAELGQTSQDILAQRALGFNCLNYDIAPEGTLYRHYLPDKSYLDANCIDGIRFELMFPSCWKGGDAIDSANHKDHVAFPNLVMTGDCPDDYPYRLPSMLFEVIWNTYEFVNRDGRFVIANGDTTGYGYHGDFIMGWDEDFLQQAVDTCTNPSGLIEDCPLFNVVDEEVATSCTLESLPAALVHENVTGPIPQLPGDVQITYGDGSTGSSGSGSVSSDTGSKPTLTYVAGDQPSNPASPLPGQVFKESSAYEAATPTTTAAAAPAVVSTSTSSTPTSSTAEMAAAGIFVETSVAGPTTTPAPALVSLPTSDASSFYSTEYITNGNLVSKILWEEEYVYVTELVDSTTTITVTSGAATPTPGARRRRRGVHLHGHGHHHI